jgi:hypothetical protein
MRREETKRRERREEESTRRGSFLISRQPSDETMPSSNFKLPRPQNQVKSIAPIRI